MNRTSRTDEPYEGDGLNQSPNAFSNDLVTNQDLNGIANARERRGRHSRSMDSSDQSIAQETRATTDDDGDTGSAKKGLATGDGQSPGKTDSTQVNHDSAAAAAAASNVSSRAGFPNSRGPTSLLQKIAYHIFTFGKFIGPGFLVAVAYIDPGNYSTGISAGAAYRFRLLFITLTSNLFAVVLQCLAVKLGTVTGLNLAEACRAFLPRWLNYFLYFLAEAAIIATDIAEVSLLDRNWFGSQRKHPWPNWRK
jgi:metal iron transporter